MKKLVVYCLYTLLFLSSSCKDKNCSNSEIRYNYIDSLPDIRKTVADTSMQISEFYPMYIGDKTDSIRLNTSSRQILNFRTFQFKKYKLPTKNDITIFIDTTKIIGSLKWHSIPKPVSIRKNNSDVTPLIIASYPAVITNISSDTLDIGFGEFLPLILEAKDENNEWKSVQTLYSYDCGTGLTNFYLPPHNIAISACPIFYGNYKTEMRVRFYFTRSKITIVSNTFIGSLNKQLFSHSL